MMVVPSCKPFLPRQRDSFTKMFNLGSKLSQLFNLKPSVATEGILFSAEKHFTS